MNQEMQAEIRNLLTSISLKMDTIGIELAGVKELVGFDKSVNEPPVPAEPIAEPFGEPGPRLPSFEEMRKSEAATSLVEAEGQLGRDYR